MNENTKVVYGDTVVYVDIQEHNTPSKTVAWAL